MRRISWMLSAALAGACGTASAATFVVNTVDDTCSLAQNCLRRAIALANANADTDTIVFDIPGDPNVAQRIVLATPLAATQPVIIDGYTQRGSSPNTLADGTNAQIRVVLDGSALGDNPVLTIRRGPSEVRGLSLVRGGYGLWIPGDAAEVNLRGSFVGVEPDGVTAAPNLWGIEVTGEFNVIGGANPADRNLISGNTRAGVILYGSSSIRNAVVGNLIGTDRHAAPVLGNGWSGVQVTGARLSRIGGYTNELQNVIAGNGKGGVYLIWGPDRTLYNIEVISRIYANAIDSGAIDDGYFIANDAGDVDDGPNEVLNHPIVTTATIDSGQLTIAGMLDTNPGRTYRVALFGNTRACGPFRGGESERFLGYVSVAADAAGHAPFRWTGPAPVPGYVSVAAQAGVGQEDLYVDSTSRISPCEPVTYGDRIFASGFQ